MTQVEYESALFEIQIEAQKCCNEKIKAETKLLQIDAEIKEAQLKQLRTGV